MFHNARTRFSRFETTVYRRYRERNTRRLYKVMDARAKHTHRQSWHGPGNRPRREQRKARDVERRYISTGLIHLRRGVLIDITYQSRESALFGKGPLQMSRSRV